MGPDGDERTAGALLDRSNQIAHGLRALGLEVGDTVALLLPNSIELMEIYLAALQIGLYVTPVNWHLTAAEAGYIVENCDARVFVASNRLAGLVAEMDPWVRNVDIRICVDGDLAGFERLAEVQEEILWACEAAHVPVVWATQVLESEARSGFPSRAEITDAAMGARAECVMLNKGPHVIEAIEVLDVVLRRMQRHHDKKRSLLSRLQAWDG
mgnify:CR=1 FL=1